MFEITKTNIAKKNQAYSKKFQLRYQILRCFSNLRARTILYIYIFCSMLFILASIIILFNLVNQQVSQILVDSSGIIFDLNSYRQQYFIMQSLVLYWIAYIHSTSQPLITMHRLHNFYQQQTSLQIGIQESEQNCYKNSFQEKICICNLDYQMIDTSKNDQMAVFKNLLQFQSILPTKIFGVESYMGFLNDKPKHIFNYPCLDYTNQSDFDPRTRPWYIEAQKAYNLSNFQQYSVRLTEHFITVLSNEIRFSIALPLINFEKSMIGAFRVLIQSKTLQEMINVWKNDTNLILTTNEGMLLVSNLFQNSGFQLGKDYFYNESITGFNFEDWQAIVKTKQSNCNNIVVGFICRQNKIDNQDYYMMHTPLGEYNLQIIIYQTKFQYCDFQIKEIIELFNYINNISKNNNYM